MISLIHMFCIPSTHCPALSDHQKWNRNTFPPKIHKAQTIILTTKHRINNVTILCIIIYNDERGKMINVDVCFLGVFLGLIVIMKFWREGVSVR